MALRGSPLAEVVWCGAEGVAKGNQALCVLNKGTAFDIGNLALFDTHPFSEVRLS